MANNPIAPNGKPSNLSAEQYALVRTPEFKAWFGDWQNDPQNSSKVVDENGEPLVVYHGAEIFNKNEIGRFDIFRKGSYFTDTYKSAKYYAFKLAYGITDVKESDTEIYNVFLNIRNPKTFDYENDEAEDYFWDFDENDKRIGKYISDGYDGVLWEHKIKMYDTSIKELEKHFINFSPNQVKLADGSNTTFDAANPDIRYADGGETSQDITCINCGWHWNTSDSDESDKYVCHKCGFDNKAFYDPEPIGVMADGGVTAFNKKMQGKDYLPYFKEEYATTDEINKTVAAYYLQDIAKKYVGWVNEIDFANDDKNPRNHFQLRMYLEDKILWTAPFIYVDDNHKVVAKHTKIELLDRDYETIKSNLVYAKGGLSRTPAPKKDRVFGSDKNKVGSAASKESAKKINLSEDIITTLSNKAKEYNEENSGNKVTLNTLKAVMRRGMGAYSTSHRPTITGGAPNSRQAWGFARVNKFLKKKSGEKVKAAYVQDDDLLEMGGTINKNNFKMIQQHYHSMKPIEDIQVGDIYVIKEDMFAPHKDHEHPQHLSTRYATVEVKSPCHRNLDSYTLEVMDCDCDNAAGRYAKGKVIERSRKHILSSGKLKSAVAKATEFKDGGELNADSQEVKEYFAHDSGNAGGLLVGKRHSDGGIKADVKSTGQKIEMEGGEAVITRGAVNSKKKYVYEGKEMTTREILSDLNVKGGGVAFADGGDVPEKMNCGCSHMKVGGISYTPQDFITLSEKEYQEHRLIDGIEKERKDHFYTLAKLNSGAISIEQALREIASKEMMIDPKYPYSE